MTHQCRLGHPAALDYLPLDAKPAQRTPQRQRLTAEEEERRRGLDERFLRRSLPIASPAASPPYEPKVGDRVRISQGVASADFRGRSATVCGIPDQEGFRHCFLVELDGEGKRGRIFDPKWLEPLPPPAPTGVWHEHDGRGMPEQLREVWLRMRFRDGTEDNGYACTLSWLWDHSRDGDPACDVVGYCLLSTPQEPEAAS
jgi:hypothetical protein